MPDLSNVREKFDALLAEVLPSAYGAALHMTRNADDAADVVQDAAVQAFRSFHQFQEGTNFKAWFFRITTNAYLQRYRQKRREPEITSVEDAPDLYLYVQTANAGLHEKSGDPAHLVLDKLDREQVGAAIEALPDEFRIVCALYFIEEFSYPEISEMVGCPVGTVRSRLHRGRKLLQKALWRVAEEQGIVAALQAEGS